MAVTLTASEQDTTSVHLACTECGRETDVERALAPLAARDHEKRHET